MSEIVVGVDGTAASEAALGWSLDEAWSGSRVTGVHVWDVPVQLEVPLDRDSSPGTGGLPVTFAALTGPPGPVLVERSRDAALLAVGASTQGTLGHGAVAGYCLHHARVPVAVVPAPAEGAAGSRAGRVCVGVDLAPESAPALLWASRAALAREAELVVTRAWQLSAGAIGGLLHPVVARHEQEACAAAELRRWVQHLLEPAAGPPLRLHSEHGSPLDILLAQADDADLLVLGSHGHHALSRLLGGSLSGQLAQLCACPLVVVPSARSRTGQPA